MEAASKNLIPVTLELGGKSPCIVLQDADIDVAARRIMWGKFLNAGQTCVAPDYVLIENTVKDAFIAAAVKTIRQFFGPEPRTSPWYGRIISRQHLRRLTGYLQGSTIICGGECDEDDLYMAPTLLDPDDMSMPVMQEEIFGPLLPVLACSGLEEALGMVKSRPTPLALYLFTRSRAAQDRVVQTVQCGGVCINDTISHILERGLPFGGLGASGMGAYHGRAGFDCFTHYKSVLRKGFFPDLRLKYPPYTLSLKRMKTLFKFLCS
jgi:acyl-CoA reductase-like NAD-dependent aldehyde dehydrogenase